jgi:hypothetical protein
LSDRARAGRDAPAKNGCCTQQPFQHLLADMNSGTRYRYSPANLA